VKEGFRVLAVADGSGAAPRAIEHARAFSAAYGAELVVAEGPTAETILARAQQDRPDIIVAGSPRRTGRARFRAGSLAERLVAATPVPALLVPESAASASPAPFNRVAVAVAFDPASERAIEHAIALTSGPSGRVTLVHVLRGVGSDAPSEPYRVGIVEYLDQLILDDRETLMQRARARLQAAAARHRTAASLDTRAACGSIAAGLRRVVDTIDADLLVVGVHTRGAASRALFGTTAAQVLRDSPVPVLAIPEASPRAARGWFHLEAAS
jgi:nucleotide-binding universal stress UspA family protein